MNIKQLFDLESSTYTYLLFDAVQREAIFIDPVLEQFERDCMLIEQLNLRLSTIFETHIHADHVTSSGRMREQFGCKIAVSRHAKVQGADIHVSDGDTFSFGSVVLKSLETPGHTSTCTSYVCEGYVFTGDALLIRGCGRTDFQEGNAAQLFESVRKKLFVLPDDTIVYPAHDYKGFTSSTIGEEKMHNPRLGVEKSKQEFVEIMKKLHLERPKKIDIAVPANLECGLI
ncbi:MAG: MBL fold metallo-hydrolase [Bdellovibrionota bacterium]